MNFQDAMNDVLQSSRYDFLTGRRVDIRDTIDELLNRFFIWLFDNFSINIPGGTGGNTGVITFIFTVIAVALVAVAGFVLIRAYLRSRVAVRHTLHDIFEELRNHTVAELLELSRTARNRRVAVRYKYIAVILSLNERDIIVIEPSATNAIILRQIKAAAPEYSMPFSQIADTFHLAWFGHKNLSDDVLGRFDSAVDRVVKHA